MNKVSAWVKTLGFSVTASILLTGCAGIRASQYANSRPEFNVREFFDGPLYAAGMAQNSKGKVERRFEIHMVGQSGRDTVTVREHFVDFDGAPVKPHEFTLQLVDSHRLLATGYSPVGDIDGVARGEAYGYAVHLTYNAIVTTNGNKKKVHVDDWMYMIRPDIVFDQSKVSGLGSSIASVTYLIKKFPPTPQNFKAMSQ